MHKLHELKEMLCEELEEYGSKGKLDVGSLDVVDKLAHAIKNIDKILEYSEVDYAYYDGYGGVDRGDRTRYSRMGGSYAKRDAMGRYSRGSKEDDFRQELKDLMYEAPNDHIKQKIQNIMADM